MQILPTTSAELASHPYREIEPGKIYHCPGRVLIIQPDDNALLILLDSGITAADCHDLEEAIRAAL